MEGVRRNMGVIDAAIARRRNRTQEKWRWTRRPKALTGGTVLARGRACTLLDVHILTGRTHQIRVHMKHIGHPVCGDPIYGLSRGAKVPRLMLHARSLAFTHPVTAQRLTFTAPLPEEFVSGLRQNGIQFDQP